MPNKSKDVVELDIRKMLKENHEPEKGILLDIREIMNANHDLKQRVQGLLQANNDLVMKSRDLKKDYADLEKLANGRLAGILALDNTPSDTVRANILVAAIAYTLELDSLEGWDWLKAWNEGDPEALQELTEHSQSDVSQ